MRKERLIVPILAAVAVIWMVAQLLSSVPERSPAKRWKIWRRGASGVSVELRTTRGG